MFLKRYSFSIAIATLFVLALLSAFYRFFILEDYLVKYEIYCDPYEENCYLYCEDEDCNDPWYYKYAITEANAVKDACGADITDCRAAELCEENNLSCVIEYCIGDDDRCETLTETDMQNDGFFEEIENLIDTV
jgi:hypothetical protein